MRKLRLLGLLCFIAGLCGFSLYCGGSEVVAYSGGSEVVGKLVNKGGTSVSKARIRAYEGTRVVAPDSLAFDSAFTNENGVYVFVNLKEGLYTFFGDYINGPETLVVVHDSIHSPVQAPSKQPPNRLNVGTDTLLAPGWITGKVMVGTGTKREVHCYIPGTSYSAFSNDSGYFTLSFVPQGTYQVVFSYQSNGRYYLDAFDSAHVISGHGDTLSTHVLHLDPANPPPPPDSLFAYYTVQNRMVTLTWSPVDIAKTYRIYRRLDNDTERTTYSINAPETTVFYDKVYTNDTLDTLNHVVYYSIQCFDNVPRAGIESAACSVSIFPLPVSFFWTKKDSASINDSVKIIAHYTSKLTPLTQLALWSDDHPDTIKKTIQALGYIGKDSISVAWKSSGRKSVYLRVIDTGGIAWFDSTTLTVVNDTPVVKYLSPDTTIDYGGAVRCSIAVDHKFGLCSLLIHVDFNNSTVNFKRKGFTFDTVFAAGFATDSGRIRFTIKDNDGNAVDTGFKIIINPQPVHNSWVACSPMITARKLLGANVMNNTLYAIGGCKLVSQPGGPTKAVPFAKVEAFDTVQKKWTSLDTLKKARYGFVSAVINNKLYVIGGWGGWTVGYVKEIEEYDPLSKHWTVFDSISAERYGSASCIINNILYIFGGQKGGDFSISDSINSYDFSNKKWSKIGTMNYPRSDFQAVVVGGKVYLLGGINGDFAEPLQSTEIFDPATNQCLNGPDLDVPISSFSAANVNDDIYIFGGATMAHGLLTNVQTYSPSAPLSIWINKSPLPESRNAFPSVVMNGQVYIVGGEIMTGLGEKVDNALYKYIP